MADWDQVTVLLHKLNEANLSWKQLIQSTLVYEWWLFTFIWKILGDVGWKTHLPLAKLREALIVA